MRPVACGMCALLATCAVLFVSVWRWISARYAEAFPSNKHLAFGIWHLAFALITMLLFVAFTFLAAEIVLRVADQPFKKRWNFLWGDVMQFDPYCGWSHFPNRSVPRKVGSNEVPQYFDSLGSRVRGPAESTRSRRSDGDVCARAHSYVAQLVSRELERVIRDTRPAGSAPIGTRPEKK